MGSRGLLYAGERHCFPHPTDGLQPAIQKQGGGDEVRQAVRDASAPALVEGLEVCAAKEGVLGGSSKARAALLS